MAEDIFEKVKKITIDQLGVDDGEIVLKSSFTDRKSVV